MISSASGLAGASEPCACANEAVSQMPDSLTFSLKGDSVGLGDLTEALGDFTAVLGEVERDVTGRRDIEWKLTALERASATVGVTPVQPQGVLLDQRAEVIRAVVAGLGTLTERPDRPPHFSDHALVCTRRLAGRRNGRVSDVVLVGAIESHPALRVSLTPRLVAHIDELVGVSAYAISALEGRLETITIHDQHGFTIYDRYRTRGTRCICDAETFDAIRSLLGTRVLVYGQIGYNKSGEPATIRVERFEALRTRDALPQAEDLRGLYAGSSVPASEHADYLREH